MSEQGTAMASATSAEPAEVRWQQQKAAMTRDSILRSAVDCLVENGYAGLTTIEVTKRAGVSRGAMHHHFANRLELVEALIDHVLHRRLEFFLGEYLANIRDADATEALAVATNMHWQSINTAEFAAYLELVMAARTDETLAEILVPATRAFDREWAETMEKTFPQWEARRESMQLASDMVAAMHLGLLVNRPFIGDAKRRSAVREALIEVVHQLYRRSDR